MKRRKFMLSLGLAVSATLSGFVRPIRLSAPKKAKANFVCFARPGEQPSLTRAFTVNLTPADMEGLFTQKQARSAHLNRHLEKMKEISDLT